jgi:NAD(P)-dependent dehydrogenase (short-subunit alcohol dehydrogenase family)
VTAGAGGVGRVVALRLAGEGAEVFVCDIDADAIAKLPEEINGARVDVADPEQVDRWLNPIARDGIGILVNNAGIGGPTAPIENIGIENWRECLAVCLDSQFYCARSVVPSMKARKTGAIVNIASTAGLMGMPNRAPYVAAKFGVVGLTKTLAMELGPFNIRVNAIAPGSITGDRMDRVMAAHAKAEGISEKHVRAMYTQGTSMQTFVDADEIADIVVYLCSARGRRISGQVIAVDGHTETLYPRKLT